MTVKFVNFFKSAIADVGGIGSGDLEFTLSSGDGALLPTLTGGHHCYLVFVDSSSNREVVKVTAVVSDTCTIVRGQDGTTPRAFLQDDLVELRLTKGSLEDILAMEEITLGNTGLHILDTDDSHDLIIKPGSDLTADRILTLVTGDLARTLTLNGNPTLSDWFDQAVKQASSPTFAAIIVAAITLGATLITATGAEINVLDGIATTADKINKKTNSEAFVNNANGNPNISDTALSVQGFPESTWESVGPTGSGEDNIWDALDGIPSGVDWVELKAILYGYNPVPASANNVMKLYARKNGSSEAQADDNEVARGYCWGDASGNTGIFKVSVVSKVFDLRWYSSFSNNSIQVYLTGYGYNP